VRLSRFGCLLCIPLVFFCTNPAGPGKTSIGITRVGWVFENTAPGYYSDNCLLSVSGSITYSGASLTLANVHTFTISSDGMTWSIAVTSASLVDSLKLLRYGGCCTSTLSAEKCVMPVGDYLYDLKLTDGSEASFIRSLPIPGDVTARGYKYLYTEDYTGQVLPLYFQMIKRAQADSLVLGSDSLRVFFSSRDSLFCNGFVWLYDNANNYLGHSEPFRNYSTKAVSGIINSAVIYNDGTQNVVLLTPSNCTFVTSAGFSSVSGARVVLTDGKQYANTSQSYDCRSVSLELR
jgi:hypothetical protein